MHCGSESRFEPKSCNSYQQGESWSRAQRATKQYYDSSSLRQLVSKPYKTYKFTLLKQYPLNIVHSLSISGRLKGFVEYVHENLTIPRIPWVLKTLRYLGYLGYLGYLRYLGSGGFRNSIPSIPTIPSIPRYLRYLQQVSSFGTLQIMVPRIP